MQGAPFCPSPQDSLLSSFPSLAFKEHPEIMVAEAWPHVLAPLTSPLPQAGPEGETQDKTLRASSLELSHWNVASNKTNTKMALSQNVP